MSAPIIRSVSQEVKDLFKDRVCPFCVEQITIDYALDVNINKLTVIFKCPHDFSICSRTRPVNYIISHYELEADVDLRFNSYTIYDESIKLCAKDNVFKIANVYDLGYNPYQQIWVAPIDDPYKFEELEYFAKSFPFDFHKANKEEFLERLETIRLFA